MGKIIGIDLGTTNSCVAVWQNQQVKIILNDRGKRTMPSYVAFKGSKRLIGDPAKNQIASNPFSTIFDAKRLIGRKFDDPEVQSDLKHWPFKVVNNTDQTKIQIDNEGEIKTFAPEEILSMILARLRECAEKHLGESVKDAVIAVPALFNNAQRQAIKDAGRIAGLNVVRIINDPTAAALAYGLNKNVSEPKDIVVFNLGGGTVDVSVLRIVERTFQVVGTSGDTHLGGEDFNARLVSHCLAKLKSEHGIDLASTSIAMTRLRKACEEAKCALSDQDEETISIDFLFEGKEISFEENITRSFFQSLCEDLFAKTLDSVKLALQYAEIDKASIDEIVLVGGSTRIPRVQEMLSNFFDGKKLNRSINPDEAVAYGAAIQAAVISSGEDALETRDVVLVDAVPLSLGMSVKGHKFLRFIERGASLPIENKHTVTTSTDNQKRVSIKIFEGEREIVTENNLLGEFMLSGIPPAPRGEPRIEVTFDLDEDSILSVSAKLSFSNKSNRITVVNDKNRLSEEEIKRMVSKAERYKAEDQKAAACITSRNNLESYVYRLRHRLSKDQSDLQLDPADKEKVNEAIVDTIKWLEASKKASQEEFEKRHDDLHDLVEPILENFGMKLMKM